MNEPLPDHISAEPGLPSGRTRLYCVGAPKTGTHSIAAAFAPACRSQHEPEAHQLIHAILEFHGRRMSEFRLGRTLGRRDLRLQLELESSQLLMFVVAPLVRLFPEARFLLTIRDPFTWLDSFLNHHLWWTGMPQSPWGALNRFRLGSRDGTPERPEPPLARRGLHPLDHYLHYWRSHNEAILKAVPAERLLIVRTDQLTPSLDRIAAFFGISPAALDRPQSHVFKARRKENVLAEFDPDFLDERVHRHCGELMHRFFPDIQGIQGTPLFIAT